MKASAVFLFKSKVPNITIFTDPNNWVPHLFSTCTGARYLPFVFGEFFLWSFHPHSPSLVVCHRQLDWVVSFTVPLVSVVAAVFVVAAPSHHKNVCAIGFLSSFCYCRRWFGLFMFAMLRLSGFCIWNRRAWKRYDLILIWRSDMIWMHNPEKRFRWGKGHFKSPFSLANIRNYILQHEVFTLQVQLLSIVLHSGNHYHYCSILC